MAKKKNTEKEEALLASFCNEETTTEIACTKCEKDKTMFGDEYEAVAAFFKLGWRATATNCYCPKCTKKYLKSK
jgi:hypothetical protein